MKTDRLGANDALALFTIVFALYLALSVVVPASTLGLVVQQVVAMALPVVVFVRAKDLPIARGLGITSPPLAAWIGAALIGVSFWFPNLWLVDTVINDPHRLEEVERDLGWTRDPMIVRLVVISMMPAICEEMLLRGVIARSMRPAIGPAGAVLVSALLFAAFHMPPVRMIPAGVFGLVLGYAAVVTDSIVPCMVMHFLNNLMVAVLLPALPGFTGLLAAHPAWTAAGTAIATTAGLVLLWRSRDFPIGKLSGH
jgi:sodium transport system permease protein